MAPSARHDHMQQARRWGYISYDGGLAIDYQFDFAEPHSEGLAKVSRRGLDGCIDLLGNWAIPPILERIGSFHYGLAVAKKESKYGYIDRSGRFVIAPSFDAGGNHCCGLANVKIDGRTGYVDRMGRMVISPQYKFAEDFSDGFALVCDPDNYWDKWFIDISGRRSYGPFVRAFSYSEGWAAIEDQSGFAFIDKNGSIVLRLHPSICAHYFVEDLAVAKDLSTSDVRMGYINRCGVWVIPARFDFASAFHDGVAVVRIGEKEGLIDRMGDFIVGPEYDYLDDLIEGRIKVGFGERYGYLDKYGHMIIEPFFHRAQRFSDGLAAVCVVGKLTTADD